MRLIILTLLACLSPNICATKTGQRAPNPLFNTSRELARKTYGALPTDAASDPRLAGWGREDQDPLVNEGRDPRAASLQHLRLNEMGNTPPGMWARLKAWCKRKCSRSRPGTPPNPHRSSLL